MTNTPPRSPSRKDIIKIIIVSVLVSIVFLCSAWVYGMASIVMITCVLSTAFVSPLIALYLDSKNPLIGSRARSINKRKVVAVSILVGMSALLMLADNSIRKLTGMYDLAYATVLSTIFTAPFLSLYYDSIKYASADLGNKWAAAKITGIGVAGTLMIIVLFYLIFPFLSSLIGFAMMIVAIATAVIITPRVALRFDLKNPLVDAKNRSPSLIKSQITVIISILAVLTLFGTMAISLYTALFINPFVPNPAEGLYKPIDESMMRVGATKICSNGENGTGYGSHNPSYGTNYQIDGGTDKALETVKKVAAENGYSLQIDKSSQIDGLALRDTTKQSSFMDLKDGQIQLNAWIYTDSNKYGATCEINGKTERVLSDSEHTSVGLNIVLPLRKDR